MVALQPARNHWARFEENSNYSKVENKTLGLCDLKKLVNDQWPLELFFLYAYFRNILESIIKRDTSAFLPLGLS